MGSKSELIRLYFGAHSSGRSYDGKSGQIVLLQVIRYRYAIRYSRSSQDRTPAPHHWSVIAYGFAVLLTFE